MSGSILHRPCYPNRDPPPPGPELQLQLGALADVLADCVAGGASVSYQEPFTRDQARAALEGCAAEVEHGRRLLLAAFLGDALIGTVQRILALPRSQPHRAEIAKVLVHRSARRRGVAARLMEAAEVEARLRAKRFCPELCHRRRRGASAYASRVDVGRRHSRLRPLSRPAGVCHDVLLEGALAA